MTSIEPELWVDRAGAAVAFYEAAFGAAVLHRVGHGDEIVAQLAVDEARFWVTSAQLGGPRFSPSAIRGATGRTLLVVDDPAAFAERAVAAGATRTAAVAEEHGWLLGRIVDPFGHEWEIGEAAPRLASGVAAAAEATRHPASGLGAAADFGTSPAARRRIRRDVRARRHS